MKYLSQKIGEYIEKNTPFSLPFEISDENKRLIYSLVHYAYLRLGKRCYWELDSRFFRCNIIVYYERPENWDNNIILVRIKYQQCLCDKELNESLYEVKFTDKLRE